jgi:hypothetical protein
MFMLSDQPAPDARCRNCNTVLHGNYCHHCGQQRSADGVPTVGQLLQHATVEMTDVDSQLIRTLRTMFFRPGVLTIDLRAIGPITTTQ